MQEGYVFNDTIANNIAVGEDYVDKQKLRRSVEIANIKEFIEELPLSYNTKIGNEGLGVSGGQKQRLFIARAVYKSPDYILFDDEMLITSKDINNPNVKKIFELDLPTNIMWYSMYDSDSKKIFVYINS
jgi:ATP-binding cassette subfamily B protein